METVSIGIDLGGTRIKIGLVNFNGILLITKYINAESGLDFGQTLNNLRLTIDELLGESYHLDGIGIAFPGIVDNFNNKILSDYVKHPGASEIDIVGWAKKNWGVPLILENDARAALIGEWQYGAGISCDNIVMITLGTGVGSAVLLNGQLLRGKNFLAGNLGGHMSIDYNGAICNCGNIGCVESVASTWALKDNLKTSNYYSLSPLSRINQPDFENIFQYAKAGDPAAIDIKEKSLRAWSMGIINLIHAYDPEKLIIGGGIMKSKEEILPFFKNMIVKHSWIPSGSLSVVTAHQADAAGILGICYLIKNKTN